jgi:hypothetical protein
MNASLRWAMVCLLTVLVSLACALMDLLLTVLVVTNVGAAVSFGALVVADVEQYGTQFGLGPNPARPSVGSKGASPTH